MPRYRIQRPGRDIEAEIAASSRYVISRQPCKGPTAFPTKTNRAPSSFIIDEPYHARIIDREHRGPDWFADREALIAPERGGSRHLLLAACGVSKKRTSSFTRSQSRAPCFSVSFSLLSAFLLNFFSFFSLGKAANADDLARPERCQGLTSCCCYRCSWLVGLARRFDISFEWFSPDVDLSTKDLVHWSPRGTSLILPFIRNYTRSSFRSLARRNCPQLRPLSNQNDARPRVRLAPRMRKL